MAIGQSLTQQQQQRQIQTATMQQMQLSHLLELPADAVEEELQKAMDDNPALEREAELSDTDLSDAGYGSLSDRYDTGLSNTYDERPGDRRVRRSDEESNEGMETWMADTESDGDVLMRQISELDLTDTERQVMEYLAGSLNDDGYLEKDDYTLADELAFGLYLDIEPGEIHRLVELFQTLEPTGIGAHSLQECLLLQLRNKRTNLNPNAPETASLHNAERIVHECFEDYAARLWTRIGETLSITPEALQAADAEIRRCNPRPGMALTIATQASARSITPDFRLSVDENGHIDIELSWQHDMRLKVSQTFVDILNDYASLKEPTRSQQDSYIYAKDRVDRARFYIDNLRRRRDTLLGTMREIARRQHDFFANEDDETLLQPMRLQDVADRVGVDISTVSRAANSKYVETRYGIYPLRQFFNAQTMEKDGQLVSSTQLKVVLREIIEAEDATAPLSDSQLTQLMGDRGYKIARRTVAKYREQMGILPQQLRRK